MAVGLARVRALYHPAPGVSTNWGIYRSQSERRKPWTSSRDCHSCSAGFRSSWSLFDVPAKKARLAELSAQLESPEVWSDHLKYSEINKQAKALQSVVEPCEIARQDASYLAELAELDPAMPELDTECEKIESRLALIEAKRSDPDDDRITFLTINAGNGGHEACAWVCMLLRMYYKYAKRHELELEMIDMVPYDPDGIRSVTLRVSGPKAYRLFKSESGVHRLSRVSPYDQADRRQTSRALVDVEPEPEKTEDAVLLERDLDVVAICGSGPGGQNVNKRHTTVVAKHLPTGLVVRCQNERSQAANRVVALELLAAKLRRLREGEQDKINEEKRDSLPDADFGTRSRSYVLSQHPLVKDHRTGKETTDVDAVMNGELEGLI